MDVDITTEPLGTGHRRQRRLPARHLAVAGQEVQEVVDRRVAAEMFSRDYADVFAGDEQLADPADADRGHLRLGRGLHLRPEAAVLRRHARASPTPVTDIQGARVLAVLGDSVTTDHISPAGVDQGRLARPDATCSEHGVDRRDFNSYGSRRGNHEVMIRGTFANIRLRNQLAPRHRGRRSPATSPTAASMTTIYDAAQRYAEAGMPAGDPGRQGVRLGLLARLGGQGHGAARRQAVSPSPTSASTGRT